MANTKSTKQNTTNNTTKTVVNTTKKQEFKLPKYLKLARGAMWFDTIGDNCSNVMLYNVPIKFVGRGYISDEEHEQSLQDGYTPQKEIARDMYNNESSEAGKYGIAEIDEDKKSYFKVSDIPENKRANIIKAFNHGILVEFDPDNIVPEKVIEKNKKNFTYRKGSNNGTDGDLVFVGKNKKMYDKLQNSKHDELIKFIKNSSFSARTNLMDLYDYELQGYNRLSRPRASVLDAIKEKLNDLGPGISPITVEKGDEEYQTKE